MNCPRCHTPLVRGRLADHSILEKVHSCATCRGTFIAPEDLEDVELQHEDVFIEFRHIPSAADQQAPLNCPACNVAMNKVKSDRDEHVTMDTCPSCRRTWLDGGELEAIKTESLVANLVNLFRGSQKSA
ncbi:MAG: zf-TFIIB domain-containing protein [Polyangiaceae bacterium]|nr:zf-TFIIB domain-containing protein [Polyangiaceae bacterium]